MADDAPRAHDRYDSGAMRDDDAAERDDASQARDSVADLRDTDAHTRDEDARQADEDLDEWLSKAHQRSGGRFSRYDDLTVDPCDWPDITPAGLARLRAHAAERRRLADIDRDAVGELIDELRKKIQIFAGERGAAARDRGSAARDRRSAADDRRSSARDRALSAKDRGQSVIEQEQAEPDDPARGDRTSRPPESLVDRSVQAMARSAQHVAASRALLADDNGRTARSTPTDPEDAAGPGPVAR